MKLNSELTRTNLATTCSDEMDHNLGHEDWENSFYKHFGSPLPCAMLTKHLYPTQVYALPLSEIEGAVWVLTIIL